MNNFYLGFVVGALVSSVITGFILGMLNASRARPE
jgi:hypothetical protein